jgi:ribA/ribD-fused uncharacterized protein
MGNLPMLWQEVGRPHVGDRLNMKQLLEFKGGYRFLSNFWPVEVGLGLITYPSVEHAYQAAKTLNTSMRERIRSATSPGKAKRLGREAVLRSDWEDVKLAVMRSLLVQKFHPERNPGLHRDLMDTGDTVLIEGNRWHDNYWGDCQCISCERKPGSNRLGKLLMEIRSKGTA